jgi:uncharacterized protein involved in exopolysaccharide biosynthesis
MDKIVESRNSVASLEQAVEKFRAKAGLLQGSSAGNLVSEQASDLNTQLVVVQPRRR